MNTKLVLLPVAVGLLALAGWSCSSSSSSEAPSGNAGAGGTADDAGSDGAAGQDSGGPDQETDASPDDASPEAAPDAIADAQEEGFPPEKICATSQPGFDETNPGIKFSFDFGTTMLMGQVMALAGGSFMATAREDYCDPAKGIDIPLDTCTDLAAPGVIPQCSTKADCAPEQDCKPDTNNSGQPIPGTEHCVTARQPLDVGTFTLSGFANGPQTFSYNSQQNGAYTATSDGSIPQSWLVFDADYTFQGNLDADAGLGSLSGTFHFPADFQLTSPPIVDLPGMPGLKSGIELVAGQDLALQWSGGEPDAVLEITLGGAGTGSKTVTCRAKNDGSFTVPAAMLANLVLNNNAFLNSLQLRMDSKGPNVQGDGITLSSVNMVQAILLNLIKK